MPLSYLFCSKFCQQNLSRPTHLPVMATFSWPIGGRYRQVSLYVFDVCVRFHTVCVVNNKHDRNRKLICVAAVYYFCAYPMWLVPVFLLTFLAAETEGRRRIISKSFHHQLRYHDKQPLVGPPESMREHVIAATHAMRRGDWKKCKDYILDIKVH